MTKPLRVIAEPPGRIFAIGDIHGTLAELETLLGFLETERALSQDDLVVFVGDYVDRGPDTSAVISTLIAFRKRFPAAVFLQGNHEDMLLDFLGFSGSQGGVYLLNGGGSTLRSYGLPMSMAPREVVNELPNDHVAFLLGLDSYVRVGGYAFVHAGLNPLRPFEGQDGKDLFWIRDEFIANIHPFGLAVIFGHTPYQNVLFHLPYKIGIDTGLVYKNMLTCLSITERELLQVRAGTRKVITSRFPAE